MALLDGEHFSGTNVSSAQPIMGTAATRECGALLISY
jgi:hypothetical protein